MYVSCNINVNTINIVPDCSNVNHMIASFATITLLYIICHDKVVTVDNYRNHRVCDRVSHYVLLLHVHITV